MRTTLAALAFAAAAVAGLTGCNTHHCPTNASVYYTAGC